MLSELAHKAKYRTSKTNVPITDTLQSHQTRNPRQRLPAAQFLDELAASRPPMHGPSRTIRSTSRSVSAQSVTSSTTSALTIASESGYAHQDGRSGSHRLSMYRKRRTNEELPADVLARNELDSNDLNYNIAATVLTLDILIKNPLPNKKQRKDLVTEAYATAIARTQQSKSHNDLILTICIFFSHRISIATQCTKSIARKVMSV